MFAVILVSLFFVFGASAKISKERTNKIEPLNKCGQLAEAVSTVYALQNLNSDESVICSRLNEIYSAGNNQCSLVISLSNQLREHEGDLPLREVNMLIYKYCVEEIQYRKSNAKR
ncbi:TPA: hypothetical protein DEG21_02910 [Patescibacteria group bacterium]|nr:hypothetical protein [Candidatus Gracilibacteria bacterium]